MKCDECPDDIKVSDDSKVDDIEKKVYHRRCWRAVQARRSREATAYLAGMPGQRELHFTDTTELQRMLTVCGYRNVLKAIKAEADKMHSVSGQEMAVALDDLLGRFGYFPVCSLGGEGAVGHDVDTPGKCPECGQIEK